MNDYEVANIYKQFSPSIFRYMSYLVQHKQVAEDLTQEVFIRFVRTGDIHRTPVEIQAWLRKTARNIAFDYLRRKRLFEFIPIHEKVGEHTRSIQLTIINHLIGTVALVLCLFGF